MRRSFEDTTGQKFNKLTVVKYTGKDRKYNSRWDCICDCGEAKNTTLSNLKTGNTKSCGCDKVEVIQKMANARKIERSSLIRLYRKYKQGAKIRNYTFDLELDEFEKLTSSDCAYCGCPPTQMIETNGWQPVYMYNGIDRVNNARGYELDNCVPCCGLCNQMKMGMGVDEFLAHIERIYQNNIERNNL